MGRIIIKENERGFLFKNGRLIKLLSAGRYFTFGGKEIEVLELEGAIDTELISITAMLANPEISKEIVTLDVKDGELGLHFRDGRFEGAYSKGKYAFFKASGENLFRVVDITAPDVPEDIPEAIFSAMYPSYCSRVEIPHNSKGVLFFGGKYERTLEPGVHYFWRGGVKTDVTVVDTRLTQIDVVGQEMLTLNKVSVRINFVCNYRITDCVKVITEIDDYKRQLHVATQLAIRDYVSKHRLDELLENKDEMSEAVFRSMKAAGEKLFLEIAEAGVKDIILPGEIRDIMNTVLVAEKRAQASVIARREEVASTRSLLNTAKLMEENATLYKLKELEYVERICEKVGTINVGGGDILAGLTAVLSGRKE